MEAKSYSKSDVSRVLRKVSKTGSNRANGMRLGKADKKKALAEFDRQAQKLVDKLLDVIEGG
jgi:hypothetical protein